MLTADGWRLDVGGDVDPGTLNDTTNDYWEGFRDTVHAVNPQGYITGEEWGIANSWLLGGELGRGHELPVQLRCALALARQHLYR